MAAVTPQMVKDLRESTGAGMSDCKKALDQAQGDMEKAMVILRERGLAAAAKKSGRAAAEGVIASVLMPQGNSGYLVEVNCETDFVTRNEGFQEFVKNIQALVAKTKPATLEGLMASAYVAGGTVQEALTALIAKIGENLTVRRLVNLGTGQGLVADYIHGGGRIGVLVELAGEGLAAKATSKELVDLAKDVALQVAAMKPQFLNRDAIPADVLKAETEVFYSQYRNQGKPEAILPKIVGSRIETWYKECCLVDQMFVKDDGKTVAAHVAEMGKKMGVAGLTVANFVRLELGEGVDKKSVDFATEVAAQLAEAKK